MLLYIYDENMILQGVVEKITSLIWRRKFWNVGEFKMLVPFTPQHRKFLRKNNIIMKQKDNEAAQIDYIHIQKNIRGVEEIEVHGKFITNWMDKRIVLNQITTTDTLPNIMERQIRENMTSPTDPKRLIPNVELMHQTISRPKNEYSSEPFINLLRSVTDLSKATKIGFRMITDVKTRKHSLILYEGRDFTADQKENPPCIFSQEFDNVVKQTFTNSVENYKNVAYVGGEEKQDTARQVEEVGEDASSLARDEIFVNATDITTEYTEDGVQHTIPPAEYTAMLRQRGKQELRQHPETLSFDSSVYPHGNLIYRKDYDLGDRVTCVNKDWGVKINVRITEITEVYQKNEENIEITFGEGLPSLTDKLRRRTN